ncbi:hypothetical protein [Sagittula salina]|uniref:Uncharacterized protein n=1 Tax=Sagittula salina TaxID=2820268 RepID=A0A940S033_9RHOB|nr:hypothetical protein [Sagittula salina]MBP0481746.1 hypothetical protein [Sagittula salina]
MLQYMLRTCALLGFAATATSFLGALHPAGDSLAVFRLPIAILAALALIRCDRPRALRWPLAALVLAMLGGHVAWWMPDAGLAPAPGDIVHYQQNLWGGRKG